MYEQAKEYPSIFYRYSSSRDMAIDALCSHLPFPRLNNRGSKATNVYTQPYLIRYDTIDNFETLADSHMSRSGQCCHVFGDFGDFEAPNKRTGGLPETCIGEGVKPSRITSQLPHTLFLMETPFVRRVTIRSNQFGNKVALTSLWWGWLPKTIMPILRCLQRMSSATATSKAQLSAMEPSMVVLDICIMEM
jgi:hypothetical protein